MKAERVSRLKLDWSKGGFWGTLLKPFIDGRSVELVISFPEKKHLSYINEPGAKENLVKSTLARLKPKAKSSRYDIRLVEQTDTTFTLICEHRQSRAGYKSWETRRLKANSPEVEG